MPKGRKRWTAAELRELRRRYPNEPTLALAEELGHTLSSTYQKARKLGLSKSAEYLASPAACRLRRGDNVGTPHRFPKGHRPWNAGTHWTAGGRSAETRFKKGGKPWTWKPVGTERVTEDGYTQRKVTDTGYPPRDWKMAHVLAWEAEHGPVPAGHVVVFRDKDKTNIVLSNLELVSRAELMRRNSIHQLPKELALAAQLVGALNRQIRKRA